MLLLKNDFDPNRFLVSELPPPHPPRVPPPTAKPWIITRDLLLCNKHQPCKPYFYNQPICLFPFDSRKLEKETYFLGGGGATSLTVTCRGKFQEGAQVYNVYSHDSMSECIVYTCRTKTFLNIS